MDPSPASTSASTTVISNLNDDCLLEIVEHLNLTDLCSIAYVSRRFRQIAQRRSASLIETLFIYCDSGHLGLRTMNTNVSREDIYRRFLLHNPPAFSAGTYQPNLPNLQEENLSIRSEGDSLGQKLLNISKFLRVFGMSVPNICIPGKIYEPVSLTTHKKRIFDLISLHCGEQLVGLTLEHCKITDEIAISLSPLLRHLRKLKLQSCEYGKLFATMLSSWSPQLRELYFINDPFMPAKEMHTNDILRQIYPKLMLISFRRMLTVLNQDIEEFLMLNSHVKKIGIIKCEKVDGSIFQFLATHIPGIEAIEIDRISRMNGGNLEYSGKFNSLSTLKLCATNTFGEKNQIFHVDNWVSASVLYAIHAANVRLQHLFINCCLLFRETDQLVDAILKFKTLKSLFFIGVPNLKMAQILGICKELTELVELKLHNNKLLMTAPDLLGIVEYAQKLHTLEYLEGNGARAVFDAYMNREFKGVLLPFLTMITSDDYIRKHPNHNMGIVRSTVEINGRNVIKYGPFNSKMKKDILMPLLRSRDVPICVNAYMKMVEIVGQRRENNRLLIRLDDVNPVAENIPKDITRQHRDTLALVAEKFCWPIFYFQDVFNPLSARVTFT